MSAASSIPQEAPENFLSVYYNFFEEVMPLLSGNAFKVALVIYRHTVGYSRQRAKISYKMLEKATGIKGRQTLRDALKEVIASGIASVYDIVGERGIKIYCIAERFFSSLTGRLLKKKEPQEAKISGLPVRLVTSDQSTIQTTDQNQWSTSETASSLPVRPHPAPQPSPQQAPPEPKDTYKENVSFKETYYDKKEVSLQKIEEKEPEEEKQVAPAELESIWNLVRSELRLKETPATYDNWLEPLKVAGCEGATLYLQAKTSYNAEHFQRRFAEQASGILSRLIHEDAEVRCLPPQKASA